MTITNSSGVAAAGVALSVLPPFGLVQNLCMPTLAAGSSCSTGIIFTPTANGVVTGTLNVSSSAFVTAAIAVLSGTGGAAGSVQLKPATLTFPTIGVGSVSPAQTVTLTNNSAEALSALTLSTSNGFQLGLTNCATSLAVGASCTAKVMFAPATAGLQTGNLTVASSSLPTSVQLPLSGMGFDFSLVSNGQSSQTVSSGQSATFALNLATMGGSSGIFTFSCGSLPANTSCTFNPPNETVVRANATGGVTVKIATGLSSTSAQSTGHSPRPFALGSFFVGFGLVLMPIAIRRRQRGTLFALLILSSFGLASCSGAGGVGGGSGAPPSNPTNGSTPAGTYSIVVTASSNELSHKVTLKLTVD